MANAIVAAERWLYGVLTGNATLTGLVGTRVYGQVVPPEASYPLVYYTLAAAADNLLTHNAVVIWSPLVYAVRYVAKAESYTMLETGAAAIETALSRASGSNVSGVVVGCIYQAPFAMVELDRDGYEMRHLGGLYRLHVQ